jgi:hypothetical protein
MGSTKEAKKTKAVRTRRGGARQRMGWLLRGLLSLLCAAASCRSEAAAAATQLRAARRCEHSCATPLCILPAGLSQSGSIARITAVAPQPCAHLRVPGCARCGAIRAGARRSGARSCSVQRGALSACSCSRRCQRSCCN